MGRGASGLFARRLGSAKQPLNSKNATGTTQRGQRTAPQPKSHAKSAKDAKEQPRKRERGRQGRCTQRPLPVMRLHLSRGAPGSKGRQAEPTASAARSGLEFLLWHEPGGSLCSTPGCILPAASRLNHSSPGSCQAKTFPFGLSFSPIPSSDNLDDAAHHLRFSSLVSTKNPAPNGKFSA